MLVGLLGEQGNSAFPNMQLALALKTSLHDLGSHSTYLDPVLPLRKKAV